MFKWKIEDTPTHATHFPVNLLGSRNKDLIDSQETTKVQQLWQKSLGILSKQIYVCICILFSNGNGKKEQAVAYPAQQSRGRLIIYSSPRDQLQHKNAEAIYVGLFAELTSCNILWITVALIFQNPSKYVGFVPSRRELGETKIRKLGIEVVVQQNVFGLHVVVNDGRVRQIVQVMEPIRYTKNNLDPCVPVEWFSVGW